jgi:NAD+ kinase
MIIALFPNAKKQRSIEISRKIYEFLSERGIQVVAETEHAATIGIPPLSEVPPKEIDFVVTLGGDGTILRAIHNHPNIDSPILAINMGSLGFMADITLDEIYPSLQKLLDGDYIIQERIVMDGVTSTQEASFAVNDIVIHRAKNPSLVDLAIFVDNQYLNTFSADGVIISTPSGSTAYSLAAGGPILTPELDAFVITPICPHTISNRPIVLTPDHKIRIEYISDYDPVEITYDGFSYHSMNTLDSLHISRSKRVFRLVSLPDHDYYSTLRTKLGWTGKLRA